MRKPPLYSALLIILVIVTVIATAAYSPAKRYIASLQERFIESLGSSFKKDVEVSIGGVRLGLRHGLGFRLYNIKLREKDGPEQGTFTAKYLFVALDILALVKGDIRIERIYVFRPRVYLTRDSSGRFNVEALISAACPEGQKTDSARGRSLYRTLESSLSIDRISFKSGEIFFRDMKRDDALVLGIGKLDLTVMNRLHSDFLEVRLSCQIIKPSTPGTLTLEGRVAGWMRAASARELKSDFRVSFDDIDLARLKGWFQGWGEGDEMLGTMDGVLSYQGSLVLPGMGLFEVSLDHPVFSVSRIHPRPFAPAHFAIRSSFDASAGGLVFSDGGIDLDRMAFRWKGKIDLIKGSVSNLDFRIEALNLPLVEAASYMPLGLLKEDVWQFLAALPRSGHVDVETRLKGAPADFGRMGSPGVEDVLYLRIVFKDCTMQLPVKESYLPFHSLNGTLELSGETLFFRHFDFWYGQTAFADVNGSIFDIHRRVSHLSVLGKAVLDVPEMFRELDHGIFPEAIREISRNMKDVSGHGSIEVGLDYRFGRGQDDKVRIRGQVVLDHLKARYEALDLPLSGLSGRIEFAESALPNIELETIVGRSPLAVKGSVLFQAEGSGPKGEIHMESPSLYLGDYLPIPGSQKRIEGAVSATGGVSWLDGSMCWKAQLRGGHIEFPSGGYRFVAENLNATMEGRRDSFQLDGLSLDLQGIPFSCRGRLDRLRPVVGHMEVRSEHVDLARLLGHAEKPEASEKGIGKGFWDYLRSRCRESGKGTDIRLKLDLGGLEFRTVSLTSVVAQARLNERLMRVDLARGNVGEGTVLVAGDADLENDRSPFSLYYSLTEVPTSEFYRALSMKPGFLDGTVSLEGSLKGDLHPSGSRLSGLVGAFSVFSDRCTIKRYGVLSKVLTLINFTQWSRVRLSDLNKEGIPCRQIKGDFRIEKGTISTEDLKIGTAVAAVALDGSYSMLTKRVDAGLSFRPMEQVDQVLDLLPVVGWVIHGPDGTIVEFHYRITGPLDDPQVRLVPFRGLDERFGAPLRRLDRWIRSLDDEREGKEAD